MSCENESSASQMFDETMLLCLKRVHKGLTSIPADIFVSSFRQVASDPQKVLRPERDQARQGRITCLRICPSGYEPQVSISQ